MGLYTNFPSGWWVILGIIYGIYVLALFSRKHRKKGEAGIQITLGIIVVILAFFIEFVAVSLGLWNYVPKNWPTPLFICYFGVGLAGYQIAKKVEELKKK